MKKVVVFIHGDFSPGFSFGEKIHRQYEKRSGKKIDWQMINGHLDKSGKKFSQEVLNKLQGADIFLCDSDNTDIEGNVSHLFFNKICENNLKEALKVIKQKNPQMKIFIKNFPYTLNSQIRPLTAYGEIIENWINDTTMKELKK